ncbi:MAG: UDP-N-acetylmuramoyl-L-alanine--D-glutamate ligase [Legionellales bacterium]|nr:UDP-N-acetylmuramoyl-L-alanine--D-glutamate ligase [Legionellales bacterium]|tara:strand:+ start:28965 stop:30362 length:1398 start_codon:yes stop_codon:yes gene_type:complete
MTDAYRVVLGLGKSGLSAARYLASLGEDFIVMDGRDNPPGLQVFRQEYPHIEVLLGEFNEAILHDAEEIIVSPGLYLAEPTLAKSQAKAIPPSPIEQMLQHCRDLGVSVIGDIELFARDADADIIGITGSNGKSTVTELLGLMAEYADIDALVGGNIGTPALDLLAEETPEFYILELSNVQLEVTESLSCYVASILNISPDHMDRYCDISEYVESKMPIYDDCEIVVVNRDDEFTWPHEDCEADEFSFGGSEPEEDEFGLRYHDDEWYLAFGDELLLPTSALKIKGRHNWLNALAALAIGYSADFPLPPMLEALEDFTGLAHRCQWVAEHQGVNWYNDSKGTNVGATAAAIAGLAEGTSGNIILLAGGLAKDAEFAELTDVVEQHVKTAILFGQDANLLERALCDKTKLLQADSLVEAVRAAGQQAEPGDIVLLSPACASFDMFKNFEDRGQQFCECVRELLHES